jgi:mycothiol synthase
MTTPQLFMRRPELTDLSPVAVLPEGYQVRAADGDDADELDQLADVLTRSFDDPWTSERVSVALSALEGVQAIYVVTAGARIVGTASARVVPETYPGTGYVHWVGVHPAERGKGLGEVVTQRVLDHFAATGLGGAVLETDDFRIPAIKVYLRLGFVPEYRHPSDQLRWSKVLRKVVQSRAEPAPLPEDAGRVA